MKTLSKLQKQKLELLYTDYTRGLISYEEYAKGQDLVLSSNILKII